MNLTGAATAAAFPLGGIGTGTVSVGARGELRDWAIFNEPSAGNALPYTFFTIHAAGVTRILESRLRPPFNRPGGNAPDLAGMPRFAESRMRGEYPFVRVDLLGDFPVAARLEAFTPLVPLDADRSGLPAAVLRYRVRNEGPAPVDVTVAGSLANAVGLTGFRRGMPTFTGEPHGEFLDATALRGLSYGSSLPEEHLRHGTMALATAADTVSAKPHWVTDTWLGAQDFWDDLSADGRLDPGSPIDPPMPTRVYGDLLPRTQPHGRIGSLAVTETVPADGERTFEFLLTWHFPNRPQRWPGGLFVDIESETGDGPMVRNFYATRFADAWQVAEYLHANLRELEAETRDFHAAVHGADLPREVVDAAASNIATLRSTTCFRLADGTLVGWEGVHDDRGSCPGSCTHVWNYAQTAAFLFPELERSMRRVEFTMETEPDGRVNFRSNRVFGGEPWAVLPAVDGQLGTVIRLYREWIFSGDNEFLRELWPNALRAMEYVAQRWGPELLGGEQHNTYDVEFHGTDPLANSLYVTALHAAANIAAHLGDTDRAARYRDRAAATAAAMDRLLWNGSHYVQRVEPGHPFQYGTGCLSDQVFGQLLAHVAGLGHVLAREHVRSAVHAVYRTNFRPSLAAHQHVHRIFAMPDEAGLLLCSWPDGDRPAVPFPYADEVWTGIEYQVAAHLIYEGFTAEGLDIVRATRARYDGYRRNPWSEIEAGNHYVRSMASWAVWLACTGVHYDASTAALRCTAAVRDAFFSTGTGWGTVTHGEASTELRLRSGTLRLRTVNGHPVDAELVAGDHLRVAH